MAANPPSIPPMASTDSGFNPDFSTPTTDVNSNGYADGAPVSPIDSAPPAPIAPGSAEKPQLQQQQREAQDPNIQQKVQEVLYSDIGVNTLLNRLKASIASARDFAAFLKRRGAIEEEHANSLKKLSRLTSEGLSKAEARHETYSHQFGLVLAANERLGDNGTQFGLTLHAMHENLLALANKMEGHRKDWKHQGLAAEKKVQDAEALADKAKAKYNQLAEDLDKVKTGDTGAGRKFGLKGPKSAAQHEEDLQRKLKLADEDYQSKVQIASANRKELVSTQRPHAVTSMVEIIKEIDAAVTMEMQKYASFNEKLVVNNGQVVSPQALKGSTSQAAPSINQLVYQINNERDFDDYILKHASKVPSVRSEMQYVKHPTLAPSQPQPTPPPANTTSLHTQHTQPPPSFSLPQQSQQSPTSPKGYQGSSFPEPIQQPNYQSYNSGPPPGPHPSQQHDPYKQDPYKQLPQYPGASSYSPVNQNSYSQPPQPEYPRGPAGQVGTQQSTGVMYNNNSSGPPAPVAAAAPPSGPSGSSGPAVNPVFGVTLEDLFNRDGSPVPLVVYQCIQAVDMYGLEVEGIYRIPGTSSHIQEMKAMFDRDANSVDFRNPEAFRHDVNSVAGLLKQFFRELPDPLLTKELYNQFIDAARIEDETMRRDSTHALINALPDPNYATLRALVLHLYRVQQASEVNRMSTANLGICWAPSVMGPHKGANMADASLQARVVLTILDNVLQIFDED